MPVIGFNLCEIEGKRAKEAKEGEIKVNSTPRITEVKETELQALGKKALSMDFEFVTAYDPELGSIKLGGEVMYLAEDNKKALEEWKKSKTLPEDMSIEVLNHIFRHCLIKIANMAEDLQLPPPIQIPRVRPSDKNMEYKGK